MGLTKAPERYMSEIEKLKRRSHQAGKEDKLRALEFMFYAHRAFLVDVDPILSELGFGRAHHRALFLVARWPGITVNQLLARLKITNQSFSRIVRDLLNAGLIVQSADSADRRQRCHFVTAKGEELEVVMDF